MNCASAIFAVVVLGLVGCDTMNRPITRGSFDPLQPPGSGGDISSAPQGVVYSPGQFVRAAMDNTAFFKNRPKGEGDADKLLNRGSSMKVISHNDSYVKVELDSGEVGFVPSVMVEDPNAASNTPETRPGEFQVYPPLGGVNPPLPFEAPAEKPPEGAIPTVIDPDAPAPAPAPPKTGSTPLPPNGEELEAEKKAKAND